MRARAMALSMIPSAASYRSALIKISVIWILKSVCGPNRCLCNSITEANSNAFSGLPWAASTTPLTAESIEAWRSAYELD